MKLKILFIPVILFAFACQNAPKEKPKDSPQPVEQKIMANAQKIELSINGMTCTGCENAIQKTINEFDGVYSSKADFEKGIAVFEFDSVKVDISNVKSAINDLGYEAMEHSILKD